MQCSQMCAVMVVVYVCNVPKLILQQDTVVEAKAKNSKAVYVATTTLATFYYN